MLLCTKNHMPHTKITSIYRTPPLSTSLWSMHPCETQRWMIKKTILINVQIWQFSVNYGQVLCVFSGRLYYLFCMHFCFTILYSFWEANKMIKIKFCRRIWYSSHLIFCLNGLKRSKIIKRKKFSNWKKSSCQQSYKDYAHTWDQIL